MPNNKILDTNALYAVKDYADGLVVSLPKLNTANTWTQTNTFSTGITSPNVTSEQIETVDIYMNTQDQDAWEVHISQNQGGELVFLEDISSGSFSFQLPTDVEESIMHKLAIRSYHHNLHISYGNYRFHFSFINSSSTAYTTIANVVTALRTLGFTTTSYSTASNKMCPCSGVKLDASSMYYIHGVYVPTTGTLTYLCFGYTQIMSLSSTTATLNGTTTASSSYLSTASGTWTVTDVVVPVGK